MSVTTGRISTDPNDHPDSLASGAEKINSSFEAIDTAFENIALDLKKANDSLDLIGSNLEKTDTDVKDLQDRLSRNNIQAGTLQHGLQVIQADKSAPLSLVNVNGRTLVNLLGNSGNMKGGLTDWTKIYGTVTFETTTNPKVASGNCLKLVNSPDVNDGLSQVYSKRKGIALRAQKFYIMAASVYVETGAITFGAYDWTGGTNGKWHGSSGMLSANNDYTTCFIKVSQVEKDTPDVSLVISGYSSQTPVVAYLADARVYEVDKTTYDKINVDPEYTGEKLAAKFPYVDNAKPIQNLAIRKHAKNLIPPFTEWRITNVSEITEPYKFSFQSPGTSYYNGAVLILHVIPGQKYVFSVRSSGEGSRWFRIYYNHTATGSAPISRSFSTEYNEVVFIPTASFITIILGNLDTTPNKKYTFWEPQLELGDKATPFEPHDSDYLAIPTVLASAPDGSICDVLFTKDAELFKLKRYSDPMDIDGIGITNWNFEADYKGFKSVYTPIVPAVFPNMKQAADHLLVKSDGRIIQQTTDVTLREDIFVCTPTTARISITVKDFESGWGVNYTPTVAEIRAYFNGYKLYDSAGTPTSTSTYNRTDGLNKAWAYKNADGTYSNATSMVILEELASGFTPYKLTYLLDIAEEEHVRAEGSIMVGEGTNYLEVLEGFIVREPNTPYVTSAYAYINYINARQSMLKHAAERIETIYENGKPSNLNWYMTTNSSYQGMGCYAQGALFNPSASWEVSYIAKDSYLLTCPPIDIKVEYPTTLKSVVDTLVKQTTRAEHRITIIENEFALAHQPMWLPAILQRGWTNYSTAYSPASYYKDSFGVVHIKGLIKGGTINVGTIFTLPQGLRPVESFFAQVMHSNGTTTLLGNIHVRDDGLVQSLEINGNNWIALDGIHFRTY
ncbi:hypothetical protein ACFLFF_30345 [Brevibacillus reuszeri]|uniref:hypothetical protein n=1 Tax=Brevibacillus reuszeri TaxID=54915 RepID=UPI00366D1954